MNDKLDKLMLGGFCFTREIGHRVCEGLRSENLGGLRKDSV